MAEYDYRSCKEFTDIVRKCFMDAVDECMVETPNDADALIIKGMATLAKSIISVIENTKE